MLLMLLLVCCFDIAAVTDFYVLDFYCSLFVLLLLLQSTILMLSLFLPSATDDEFVVVFPFC